MPVGGQYVHATLKFIFSRCRVPPRIVEHQKAQSQRDAKDKRYPMREYGEQHRHRQHNN
jgi:hypothetical protein